MKITRKEYRCPTCGNLETHSTNHFGEIYCACKKCGAIVLYCNEPYAIADFEERAQCKVMIHWYLFRINDEHQLSPYMELSKGLRDLKYPRNNGYVPYSYRTALKEHVGKEITVYNKDTYQNQFISSVGRLHHWQEFPWDNHDLREGYWLEFVKAGG